MTLADPLARLHLDDASMDAAWNGAVARLRAEHGVGRADAMLAQAAANLAHWKANPAPWDPAFVMPADEEPTP